MQTKKLSLLLSFYFHVILEHLKIKPLYKQIFGTKGFFVLRYRTLEFPGFCVTRHLAGGRESSYGGLKNITDFWRFCYLNIPYLRINITLTFMSSSSENSKTDVSVGFRWPYLCPSKDTNMASPYKAL